MDNEELDKRIDLYIKHHTDKPQPPDCKDCTREAEYWDQEDSEHYCEICLEASLRSDLDGLISYTDEYYKKTNTP